MGRPDVAVSRLEAEAFTIPTDEPEADGTLSWDSTTTVVVHATAGGTTGLGYTYAPAAAAEVVTGTLAGVVTGGDAMAPPAAYAAMARAVRNAGRRGLVAMALSATDAALWDLKARLLDLPLSTLLGAVHDRVPVYGSGGFTTYSDARLREQLGGWAQDGLRMVKMKVGSEPDRDPHRVGVARDAIGAGVALFVDANGAYGRAEAVGAAHALHEAAGGIAWLEEPVTSDDLAGLRFVRERVPPGVAVAAGEYAWCAQDLRALLDAQAVDVLQADVTRCGGIDGMLDAGAQARAANVDLSAHCAPAQHVHVACALERLVHLELFHDHRRLEALLFDGTPELRDGALWPALDRPGNGLELRRADARRFPARAG